MFDCSYPRVSSNIFNEYGCYDFYRYAKEVIPPYMPESKGHEVTIYMFFDANLTGDKYTSINKAPIHCYSKRN